MVVVLYKAVHAYRQIFTDGRELPKDPNPAWFGYSVGRWEGDVFVVDTAGFNDNVWLDNLTSLTRGCSSMTSRKGRFSITVSSPPTVRRCFDRLEQIKQVFVAFPNFNRRRWPHGLFEYSLVGRRNDEWLRQKSR
jgi:hypothetical protein